MRSRLQDAPHHHWTIRLLVLELKRGIRSKPYSKYELSLWQILVDSSSSSSSSNSNSSSCCCSSSVVVLLLKLVGTKTNMLSKE